MKKLNGIFDEKRLTTILSDNNFTETCLLASAILIVNTKNIRKYKKKKKMVKIVQNVKTLKSVLLHSNLKLFPILLLFLNTELLKKIM